MSCHLSLGSILTKFTVSLPPCFFGWYLVSLAPHNFRKFSHTVASAPSMTQEILNVLTFIFNRNCKLKVCTNHLINCRDIYSFSQIFMKQLLFQRRKKKKKNTPRKKIQTMKYQEHCPSMKQ